LIFPAVISPKKTLIVFFEEKRLFAEVIYSLIASLITIEWLVYCDTLYSAGWLR